MTNKLPSNYQFLKTFAQIYNEHTDPSFVAIVGRSYERSFYTQMWNYMSDGGDGDRFVPYSIVLNFKLLPLDGAARIPDDTMKASTCFVLHDDATIDAAIVRQNPQYQECITN
ncbi:hypothetical protein [Parasulfitobacter algicola]|uniref:Uncharacterized protein n=1 Tax=Parasulfitobacter algicola TaxID=2614809 RepID=A0ABX2IVR8_9RHOB|nr:hypothetical protein [Sulfitobacter algicola]NSX57029.1 hypothetical protein [Sulfitobacter algicola]